MVEHGKEEAVRGRADAHNFSPCIFTHRGSRFTRKDEKEIWGTLEMNFSFFKKTLMEKEYETLLEML
jgi:hypothetical protein